MRLSSRGRIALIIIAIIGLLGPNGVFLYYAMFRMGDMLTALGHPVTLAYVVESFIVMGLVAVYIARKPKGRLGWKAFIAFSLIGGLGFSIPAFMVINASGDGG